MSTDVEARREELKTLLLAHGVGHVQNRVENEDILYLDSTGNEGSLYRDSNEESESSNDDECESDDFPMFFGMENEEIIKARKLCSSRHRFMETLLPY